MRILISIFTIILIAHACIAFGQDVEHIDWKHPVKFSGNISLQLQSYSAIGIPDRQQPFTWVLTGAPTVTLLGVQLPFSFLFSNFDNRYYQPFNQFGVSPTYKWIKLHLGYRNVQFSQFTLAGYRMLGGGVELTPKGFRFGFMYGRLNRSTTIDSLQNANPLAYRTQASYTRMAYAVKVGVGNEKNYFDLSFLKGWDVENSLSKQYRDSVAAQDNKAFGITWQTTFLKHFVWKTDIGISIYTLDLHAAPLTDSSSSSFNNSFITSFVKPTLATQYLTAGETRLGYHGTKIGADVIYRRIDPDYKSMGAYFFQTDVEQYSLAPYLHLDSGRLLLNGTIGFQHDNLYGLKTATSSNFIGSFNGNYNPSSKFGINANYSNFGMTQNPTVISPQSELFKQVSQNVTLVPYLNFFNDKGGDNVQLVSSYQSLHSPTSSINASPDQNTLVGSLSYSHSWYKKNISVNVALNYNNTTIANQGNIGAYGVAMGGSMTAFKNKTNFNINVAYNSNYYNSAANGYTLLTALTCTVPIYKKHSLQFYGSYLGNHATNTTIVQTFSEYTFRVTYGFSF